MKRKLLLFILISCFVLGFAGTALARDLVVENRTSFSMHELYIAADYRHGWGPNLLAEHLYPNAEEVVPLDYNTHRVLFKIKVIERIHGEAREYIWHDVSLHDIQRISLFYDHRTHSATFRLQEQ
jgi:hypothetical protein